MRWREMSQPNSVPKPDPYPVQLMIPNKTSHDQALKGAQWPGPHNRVGHAQSWFVLSFRDHRPGEVSGTTRNERTVKCQSQLLNFASVKSWLRFGIIQPTMETLDTHAASFGPSKTKPISGRKHLVSSQRIYRL